MVNNMRIIKSSAMLLLLMLILLVPSLETTAAKKQKTYTITTSSKPINKSYAKYRTYNTYTKHYYLLRSYMERLEKEGGGTLVLKKGTYLISNTIYIPSNVTLKLSDGVTIKKTVKTGKNTKSTSSILFALVPPSKAAKSNALKKYSGIKNVSIVGTGTSSIDMSYTKNSIGVMFAHATNIKISGISFKNNYEGRLIRFAASKDVVISQNTFTRYKGDASKSVAVQIETTDSLTKAFSAKWCAQDKLPSDNVIIKDNTFSKMGRAIGTHYYTEKVYHTRVQIQNNIIKEIGSDAIKLMNYKTLTISGNQFKNIVSKGKRQRGMILHGVINPNISMNSFDNVSKALQMMPARNSGSAKKYKITYNKLSTSSKSRLQTNVLRNMDEYFVRYNPEYGNPNKYDTIHIIERTDTNLTVSEKDTPYKNYFMTNSRYNEKTRQYYAIRSVLEHFERIGGGTLTIKEGTYQLPIVLYIPSNVTIIFEAGVTLNRSNDTGSSYKASSTLFQMVEPSKAFDKAVYSDYNGVHDVKFIGQGTKEKPVIFNLNYYYKNLAIEFAHSNNITVEGITFTNMYDAHFIELNSSNNIRIVDCAFSGHSETKTGHKDAVKEGINIDNPDIKVGGFTLPWSSFDKTPCKNITIENCEFNNLERALGTHNYSAGVYHENIQILNNKMTNMDMSAIIITNWQNSIIKGNVITNVIGDKSDTKRDYQEAAGIFVRGGLINPTIINNTFSKLNRPIEIKTYQNSVYGPTVNKIDSRNKELMRYNVASNVLNPEIGITSQLVRSWEEKYSLYQRFYID